MSLRWSLLALLVALGPAGCAPTPLGDAGEGDANEPFDDPDLGTSSELLSVGGAVGSRCATSSVRGLSEQLIEELNCMRPGMMASIDGISGVTLGSSAFPYLQSEAAAALRRAVSRRSGSMTIGLERAPAEVAAISVTADGFPRTDRVSGAERSPRLAVQETLTRMGDRVFAITTYGADGSVQGTLRRTVRIE